MPTTWAETLTARIAAALPGSLPMTAPLCCAATDAASDRANDARTQRKLAAICFMCLLYFKRLKNWCTVPCASLLSTAWPSRPRLASSSHDTYAASLSSQRAAVPRSYQPCDRFTTVTTASMTGTSMRTPTPRPALTCRQTSPPCDATTQPRVASRNALWRIQGISVFEEAAWPVGARVLFVETSNDLAANWQAVSQSLLRRPFRGELLFKQARPARCACAGVPGRVHTC